MNIRKGAVLAFCALAIAGGGILLAGKRYLENNKRFESLVLQAVSPYLKGTFQVGKVTFGFFSVDLKKVSLNLPAQSLAITIDDINVTLSWLRLLRFRGDLSRSIGTISLIGPSIVLSLSEVASHAHQGPQTRSDAQKTITSVLVPRHLAVGFFNVKRGTIGVRDKQGEFILLGDHLNGRMWDTESDLQFELQGTLASRRRNLSVSGSVSWRGEKHHLALRINEAAITRPLSYKSITVTGGTLSGVLEFAFPDTVSLATLETQGWMSIHKGICRAENGTMMLDSVNLHAVFDTMAVALDSLRCRFGAITASGEGVWHFRDYPDKCNVNFFLQGISADSLGIAFPAKVVRRITGKGWCKGTLSPQKDSGLVVTVNAGGVALYGQPLTGLYSRVRLVNKRVVLDSLLLVTPAASLSGSGLLDFGLPDPAYTFHCAGAIDSLGTFSQELAGKVAFSGTVQGCGATRKGVLSISAANLLLGSIPLGNALLSARINDQDLIGTFTEKASGMNVRASGVVERFLSPAPKAHCTLSTWFGRAHPLVQGVVGKFFELDSVKIGAVVSGWTNAMTLSADFDPVSGRTKGGLRIHGEKKMNDAKFLAWRIDRKPLTVGGVPVALGGSGRLYVDSLVIDSLAAFDRLSTSGKVVFLKPARCNILCNFGFSLRDLVAFSGWKGAEVDEGRVFGSARFFGNLNTLETRADLHVRDGVIGGFGTLQTDAVITGTGDSFVVLPLVVRKDKSVVLALDTISTARGMTISGCFDEIDIRSIAGNVEGVHLGGFITGSFTAKGGLVPMQIECSSKRLTVNSWNLDSLSLAGSIDSAGLRVSSVRTVEGETTVLVASGFLPWNMLRNEQSENDTLRLKLKVQGDIIGTLNRCVSNHIDGSGQGTLRLSLTGLPGNWDVAEGLITIPRGKLLVEPIVTGAINNFSCTMSIDDSSRVSTLMSGMVGKRPVRLFSTHGIPAGYSPLVFGPFDLGVLQIETPSRGIDIHLPGFMEPGETGDIEVAPKKPFSFFSFSGPANHPVITGKVLLRDVEFTYPPLSSGNKPEIAKKDFDQDESENDRESGEEEAAILSEIKWDIEIRPIDRKVIYFRDIANKKTRFMRFLEANVDPGSFLHIGGCHAQKNLKLSGQIRSYHGAVYYGKTFDRNFDVGLEFIAQKNEKSPGYNNHPLIWGSAEAFSDTSRLDRVTLTALIQDNTTGVLAEKGRLDSKKFNIIFHLSTDFEELPGESEREYYRQAGLQFSTVGNAGKAVSDFGEQYLRRYFFQRFERKLAKSVGLDVINIETSIASNYFNRLYNSQFYGSGASADYLTLANVGITVGRYFLRDNIFLKARGELIPLDAALTPGYSFGLEFQPGRFLFMDVDYGFYKGALSMEHNPSVNLQLRLPITGIRNYFDF